MKMFIIAALIGIVPVSAIASERSQLVEHLSLENIRCRGGSESVEATDAACERRNRVSRELRMKGCRYHMGDYWTCQGKKVDCVYSEAADRMLCK